MDGFTKFHFKDIDSNDEILYVIHRNWFYLLSQYFVLAIFSLVVFAAVTFLPTFYPALFTSEFKAVTMFVENLFMLAIWIFGFLIWIDYYFDLWVITSERIVNIEQKGLFMRRVSELRYAKIQDVTTEVNGFFPTMLNYGDVRVQTAGEEEEFVFKSISDPYHVKSIILDLQRKNDKSSTDELGAIIRERIVQ